MKYYCVTTNYFCCRVDIDNDTVVDAAPIMKWSVGKSWTYIKQWIQKKKGTVVELG